MIYSIILSVTMLVTYARLPPS